MSSSGKIATASHGRSSFCAHRAVSATLMSYGAPDPSKGTPYLMVVVATPETGWSRSTVFKRGPSSPVIEVYANLQSSSPGGVTLLSLAFASYPYSVERAPPGGRGSVALIRRPLLSYWYWATTTGAA